MNTSAVQRSRFIAMAPAVALAVFWAFGAAAAFADITVTPSLSQEVVMLGGQVQYTITVSSEDESIRPGLISPVNPNFQGVRPLSPAPATSTQTRIVNGKMSMSVSMTWHMLATDPGTATIGPSTLRYRGKDYPITACKLEIVRDHAQTMPEPLRTGDVLPAQTEYPNVNKQIEGRLFARLDVSNSNPYLMETVTVSCWVYIDGLESMLKTGEWKTPDWKDVYVEQVDLGDPRLQAAKVGNRTYQAVEAGRFLVTPTRTGAIEIPMTQAMWSLRVRNRSSFEDRFFNFGPGFDSMFDNYIPVNMPTAATSLNVRPLPTNGRPASFQNAVGQFTFTASPDKKAISEDDLLTLRVEVGGEGYLGSIAEPRLPDLTGWRNVGTENKIEGANDLMSLRGKKIFEYLLRPEQPGQLTIPKISYAFFDPAEERYIEQVAGPFAIQVSQGEARQLVVADAGGQPVSTSRQPRVFGEQLAYIHTTRPSPGASVPFYHRALFLLWLALPPLVLAAALGWRTRQAWRRANEDVIRKREARTRARKELRQARAALDKGDAAAFWNQLGQALRGYLAVKLDRSAAGLTLDEIESGCTAQGADPDDAHALRLLLEQCDEARYVSVTATLEQLHETFDETGNLLQRLDKAFAGKGGR